MLPTQKNIGPFPLTGRSKEEVLAAMRAARDHDLRYGFIRFPAIAILASGWHWLDGNCKRSLPATEATWNEYEKTD